MQLFSSAIQLVFGAFCTVTGVLKLLRHPHMVSEFGAMRLPYGLAVASGLTETVLGPGLIYGIWNPRIGGYARSRWRW